VSTDYDDRLDARIAEEADENGDIQPPWARFPTYTRTTIGWRMGSGEDWMWMWRRWLSRLTGRGARLAYLRRHPKAPRTWANMVHDLLEEGDFVIALPEDVVEGLIREGLVGDDVAFDTWAAHIDDMGIPPWGDFSPPWKGYPDRNRERAETSETALRYHTRGLSFWARWVLVQRHRRGDDDWIARWRPSPGWERFYWAAFTGEVGDVEGLKGLTRVSLELAANGAPETPWRRGLPPADYADSYDVFHMRYTDAWLLWASCTFDDAPTWLAYLRHRGPVPSDWEALIQRELGWAVR